MNQSIINLYNLHKEIPEISYEEFQNKFYKEFYESIFNDFSIIIKKYNLDHNFIYQNMNLLCFLACFSKNKKDIKFFKKHFTKKQLKYMAKYKDTTSNTVFHYSANNIENIKVLKFLLKIGKDIENPNEESCFERTPIDIVEREYDGQNCDDCKWLKIMRKTIVKKSRKKNIR